MTNPLMSRLAPALLALALVPALAGCIDRRVPAVSYYSLFTLTQLEAAPAPAGTTAALRIGIEPLSIPDALKRTQIVTRDRQNAYSYSETHRWAGVLEKDIAYVLGDNLGALLGTEAVSPAPWGAHFTPTCRLAVVIGRFDGNPGDEAVLDVRWSLVDATGTTRLREGRNQLRRPLPGADYPALVKAESELLAEFSRIVAAEIQAITTGK